MQGEDPEEYRLTAHAFVLLRLPEEAGRLSERMMGRRWTHGLGTAHIRSIVAQQADVLLRSSW